MNERTKENYLTTIKKRKNFLLVFFLDSKDATFPWLTLCGLSKKKKCKPHLFFKLWTREIVAEKKSERERERDRKGKTIKALKQGRKKTLSQISKENWNEEACGKPKNCTPVQNNFVSWLLWIKVSFFMLAL